MSNWKICYLGIFRIPSEKKFYVYMLGFCDAGVFLIWNGIVDTIIEVCELICSVVWQWIDFFFDGTFVGHL